MKGFVISPISITDNIVDELPSNVSSAAGPGEARERKGRLGTSGYALICESVALHWFHEGGSGVGWLA